MSAAGAVTGLDHVQVAAPPGGEAAARRFYGDLLGLEELTKPAELEGRGGVWFRCGPHALHVGIDDGFIPGGKAHPALGCRDAAALDDLAGRLEAAGHPVEWDTALPGVARLHVRDPFGNRLELLVPPASS